MEISTAAEKWDLIRYFARVADSVSRAMYRLRMWKQSEECRPSGNNNEWIVSSLANFTMGQVWFHMKKFAPINFENVEKNDQCN